MDPVEINAGAYYLRQLRADGRIDDRPALVTAFADARTRHGANGYHVPDLEAAGRYVALRAREWTEDRRCSWAVAEPLSGELLGEVGLKELDLTDHTAEVACWTLPRYRGRGIIVDALRAALRFGFDGLGLEHISYRHAKDNHASQRVAEKCGFTLAARVPGEQGDLVNWSVRASDRQLR